jgi:hypothetical protein
MPRKGPDERSFGYELKLTPERARDMLEKRRARMLDRQRLASAELAELEDRVRGVLGSFDLNTTDYVWYYDFARQVYKLVKKFKGGKALENEVRIRKLVWKERGLDQDILDQIQFEVFAVKQPETQE